MPGDYLMEQIYSNPYGRRQTQATQERPYVRSVDSRLDLPNGMSLRNQSIRGDRREHRRPTGSEVTLAGYNLVRLAMLVEAPVWPGPARGLPEGR